MKKAIALFALSLALVSMASAQTFAHIGTSGNYLISVPQGNFNHRVGNAVLVRLVAINSKDDTAIAMSSLVLAACDGSWITDAIQNSFKIDGTSSVQEMFDYGKESEKSLPLDSVSFHSINETKLFYSKSISRVAPSLCKVAGKEPRNILIPVAYSTGKNDIGNSMSIVLGTSTREKNIIDVWFRSTEFKLVPILNKEGQPIEFDGRVQKQKEATGKYSMQRSAFDCKDRTMATYELAEYQEGSGMPQSTSVSRQKLLLSSVIPDSVGEGLLDAVCALYGAK